MKYYILFAILIIPILGYLFSLYTIPTIEGIPIGSSLIYFLIILGALIVIYAEIKRISLWKCIITNYRIIVDTGLIRKHTDSVSYNMIVNVRGYESMFDKIFGIGDIDITTARGHQEIALKGVNNYSKIENMIYTLLERHRKQFYQSYKR